LPEVTTGWDSGIDIIKGYYVPGYAGTAAVAEEAKDIVAEFEPTIDKYNAHMQKRKLNTRMLKQQCSPCYNQLNCSCGRRS
jgi:hypothetical protein